MSNTNRRGVLALLGVGAASAPTLISANMERAGISNGIGALGSIADKVYDGDDKEETEFDGEDYYENKSSKEDKAKEFIDRSAACLDKAINNRNSLDGLDECIRRVYRLDSDLASSRSLSLSARIRLQAVRNLKMQRESEVDSAYSRLNNTVRSWSEYIPETVVKSVLENHLQKHAKVVSFADILLQAVKKV